MLDKFKRIISKRKTKSDSKYGKYVSFSMNYNSKLKNSLKMTLLSLNSEYELDMRKVKFNKVILPAFGFALSGATAYILSQPIFDFIFFFFASLLATTLFIGFFTDGDKLLNNILEEHERSAMDGECAVKMSQLSNTFKSLLEYDEETLDDLDDNFNKRLLYILAKLSPIVFEIETTKDKDGNPLFESFNQKTIAVNEKFCTKNVIKNFKSLENMNDNLVIFESIDKNNIQYNNIKEELKYEIDSLFKDIVMDIEEDFPEEINKKTAVDEIKEDSRIGIKSQIELLSNLNG